MSEPFPIKQGLSQQVMRNIVWNFFGQGVILTISFLGTPYIVHRLNVNLYGIYTLIGVIIGYFSFLQLGLGTASIKYISQYLAQGDEEKIRTTFWSCIFVYLFLGVLGTAAIAFSARILVEKFFKIPPEMKEVAISALQLGSFGFLVSMLSGITNGVIRAMGRFDIINKIEILLYALQIGLTVTLLRLDFSLKEIIISNLIAQTLSLYLYWHLAKRLLPFLAKPSWDGSSLIQLFKFGGLVTISSIVGPILTNIEKIFLITLRSVSALTYYSVPYSLIMRLSLIPSAFTSVIFPAFSHLQSKGQEEINKELHFRSTLYIFFICIFFVIFFVAFGRSLLAVWLGHDFAEKSSQILIILSLAVLTNALAGPSFVALQGMGKPHLPAMFHLVETVIYLPLGYVLIYKFGGVGAALAWFLRVFLDTVLLHMASSRLFGEHLLKWYGKLFYRGFPPLAVASLLFLWLKTFDLYLLHPLNLAGILLILILYLVVVWKRGLDNSARGKAVEFWRKLHRWT